MSLSSPAEGGEPVEEVETDGDNLDGDEDQDPERVLEGLQEGDQLARPRLLHTPVQFIANNFVQNVQKLFKMSWAWEVWNKVSHHHKIEWSYNSPASAGW